MVCWIAPPSSSSSSFFEPERKINRVDSFLLMLCDDHPLINISRLCTSRTLLNFDFSTSTWPTTLLVLMIMMTRISKQVMPERQARKSSAFPFVSLFIELPRSYPQQCSALRKNGFVMLKSRPCKIMEMSTSKTGKHGHAKVRTAAVDRKIASTSSHSPGSHGWHRHFFW